MILVDQITVNQITQQMVEALHRSRTDEGKRPVLKTIPEPTLRRTVLCALAMLADDEVGLEG